LVFRRKLRHSGPKWDSDEDDRERKGWVRTMDERCGWRVGGVRCEELPEGRGVHYAVRYAPIPVAGRWVPLCETHARGLTQGFTITTDAGAIDIPAA
jgi:hypothetical protein